MGYQRISSGVSSYVAVERLACRTHRAKRLYLVCFSGFTLASALCALSWSAGSLIGFRLLQGVSGGLMAPMTQLTLARVAGKHLVRVVGYAAVPVLLGPILEPTTQ
jgi:MFS family permease